MVEVIAVVALVGFVLPLAGLPDLFTVIGAAIEAFRGRTALEAILVERIAAGIGHCAATARLRGFCPVAAQ